MNAQMQTSPVTADDRLWAALVWLPAIGWIIAILVLLMEQNRARPFQRFHAVNALGVAVAVGIVNLVLVHHRRGDSAFLPGGRGRVGVPDLHGGTGLPGKVDRGTLADPICSSAGVDLRSACTLALAWCLVF